MISNTDRLDKNTCSQLVILCILQPVWLPQPHPSARYALSPIQPLNSSCSLVSTVQIVYTLSSNPSLKLVVLSFFELPQQAFYVVNLLQSNVENMGALNAKKTWWSVVNNTLKFPGSLRTFGINAFSGRKPRLRIFEQDHGMHQSICSLILRRTYSGQNRRCTHVANKT